MEDAVLLRPIAVPIVNASTIIDVCIAVSIIVAFSVNRPPRYSCVIPQFIG